MSRERQGSIHTYLSSRRLIYRRSVAFSDVDARDLLQTCPARADEEHGCSTFVCELSGIHSAETAIIKETASYSDS